MQCPVITMPYTVFIKMTSLKVVTPVKTGLQAICNYLYLLDSSFRRNDEKWCFLTFYDFITICAPIFLNN
jgi:hypothetical protein